jgi:outer membrane protein assembly factor BamD
MKKTVAALAAVTALALSGLACKSAGFDDDPILRLSVEESLEQGKALMEKEKYAQAREYFTHAFEVEPNSPAGREGLLLAADMLYLMGGSDNFLKAEAKYRDFQNRFPTSDKSSYVQFQIANSLAERMRKPDRDQTVSRQALLSYEEVIRLYPTSEYAAQSREQMKVVRETLAESEFLKGRFNLRLKLPPAAISRFEYLLEEFPDYNQRDKVYFFLGLSHHQAGDAEKAEEAFGLLRSEYPSSSYLKKIPKPKRAKAGKSSETAVAEEDAPSEDDADEEVGR